MPAAQIPEGVEVVLLEDGEWIEYKGKRSWGGKKRIRIDRLWVVKKDGKILGAIRYIMITREQKTPGRMYVNSRWESPGFQYWMCIKEPYGIHDCGSRPLEAFSKSDAIESIVRDAK